jgi:hypothetical protein
MKTIESGRYLLTFLMISPDVDLCSGKYCDSLFIRCGELIIEHEAHGESPLGFFFQKQRMKIKKRGGKPPLQPCSLLTGEGSPEADPPVKVLEAVPAVVSEGAPEVW